MPTVRRASEVRQVELADAALRVIATRGIAALSTRSLAAEVGLSSGAIFRHFATLDELLDAVVARVEEVLEGTFPPPGLPPLERLERFVAARAAAVGQQQGILRLVLSEQFLLALPRGGSARLQACVRRTAQFLTTCLRAGQGDGTVRTDLEAGALAPIVMGTIQVLARSPSPGAGAPAVTAALLTLLRPPPAVPAARKKRSP